LSSLAVRAAACVCSRGYVNGSGGWICRRLASLVGCGVATAVVDPATSWGEPGCPPLAPGSCEPPGDRCAPPLAPGSLSLLRRLRPTARAWQLRGSRLCPTGRSWELEASWLCPCSLLSPRGWRASKLQPCELVLRLQTLQPVEVEGQVVEAEPGRSVLVP
jgi:hypothetical protein